jgi:hypothetical protein
MHKLLESMGRITPIMGGHDFNNNNNDKQTAASKTHQRTHRLASVFAHIQTLIFLRETANWQV